MSERGEMSPSQLSRETGGDLSSVSYHVKRLVTLGCAEPAGTRPVRGVVEHFYRASDHPLIDAHTWESLEAAVAEDGVGEIMREVIDDFVASRGAGDAAVGNDFHVTHTPLELDAQGLREQLKNAERCRLKGLEIEKRSGERRERSGEPPVPASSSIVFFTLPGGPTAKRES